MKSHTLFTAILISGILLIGSNFALAASSTNDDRVNSEKTDKTETDKTDRDENADDMRGIDGTVRDPDTAEKQRSLQPSDPSSPQNSPPPGSHPSRY